MKTHITVVVFINAPINNWSYNRDYIGQINADVVPTATPQRIIFNHSQYTVYDTIISYDNVEHERTEIVYAFLKPKTIDNAL